VFLTDRDAAALAATEKMVLSDGGRVVTCPCDVTDSGQVAAMVRRCLEELGRVDALVNNVGGSKPGGPVELSEADWQNQLSVNLTSVFLTCKHVIPVMKAQGGGSIVNTASALSYVGMPGQATYAGTKAGVVQMSRTAAWEYGAQGVRINALSPGGVLTDIAVRFFADNPQYEAAYTACHALGRLASPAEIAAAALFLASDDASFVTGINLPVDAGWGAH
jgi:hypothetical protein